jgi:hypothetical protein
MSTKLQNKNKNLLLKCYLMMISAKKTPWYLSNGIDKTNCIAAYRAIGATSYSNSKINLVNSGTYNLVSIDGITEPSWSSANGWSFTNHGLNTTLKLPATDHQWSVIVRYKNATFTDDGHMLFGAAGAGLQIGIISDAMFLYNMGESVVFISPSVDSTLCMSGPKFYIDGEDTLASIPTDGNNAQTNIYIGRNNHNTNPTPFIGSILAIAFYNITLSADQVIGLTGAIDQL